MRTTALTAMLTVTLSVGGCFPVPAPPPGLDGNWLVDVDIAGLDVFDSVVQVANGQPVSLTIGGVAIPLDGSGDPNVQGSNGQIEVTGTAFSMVLTSSNPNVGIATLQFQGQVNESFTSITGTLTAETTVDTVTGEFTMTKQ